MSEEQPTYKVTDRRLFNPDGTPREVPEEQRPEPKTETTTSNSAGVSAAVESPAKTETATSQAGRAENVQPDQPTASAGESASSEVESDKLPGTDDPASFASFLMSIASNAASALGMMEHPVTGQREVDLELGKHWIDVLGMLQKKTRGNLLREEQQILEGLLADLRMQYVSLTSATTSKARAYSSRDITGG